MPYLPVFPEIIGIELVIVKRLAATALITPLAGLRRDHEDDFFPFINFIEKPVRSNSVTPRLRLIASQLPDVYSA